MSSELTTKRSVVSIEGAEVCADVEQGVCVGELSAEPHFFSPGCAGCFACLFGVRIWRQMCEVWDGA